MSIGDLLRRKREQQAHAEPPDNSAAAAEAEELARRGGLLRQQARYEDAARHLMRAIELKHDLASAHFNLGLTYLDQGHAEDAVDCLQLAVHFDPRMVDAHVALGGALARLGRLDPAQDALRHALELDPGSGSAWFALGGVDKERGNLDAAIECYRKAAARDPASAEVQCQLGYALLKAGHYAESRAGFDAALALRPEFMEAHHNLGLLLLETGHPEDALREFERALALRPGFAETRTCVAHALRDLGRVDEAILHYDAVLAAQPRFADAVINRAYALLMREDYAAGWAEYERRFDFGTLEPRGFPFTPWRGESLAGKRVLAYAEQGLGDEIMFASCVPDLLKAAAHCVIECDSRLQALFARSFPQAHVHGGVKSDAQDWAKELPPIDVQVALGSLPHHFRRARADFPTRPSYLKPDPRRVEFWRREIRAEGRGPRVGIAWRGGSLRTRLVLRSTQLSQWLPLLRAPGAKFYSLQYGDVATEVAGLRDRHGVTIAQTHIDANDLDELAALVCGLDLVISVDNTVAHLAGALGQHTWVMLPFSPEWRYPRTGDAMPWYPSARLFRQQQPRQWEPVIGEVSAALRNFTGAPDV